MNAPRSSMLPYRCAHFATRLPLDYRYTASHAWLARQPDGRWRVGLTAFGTRLLGEMVDHGFEVAPGTRCEAGQRIGWIEGFKAVSDLHSVATGLFVGENPALIEKLDLVNDDPYGAGWLYVVDGVIDPQCVDADGYSAILDRTIDRLRGQEQPDGPHV